MYPKIKSICDELILQFDSISTERKRVLTTISEYIQQKKSEGLPIQLMYVCTHNSRRSHFGQIWAAVAASYYGVLNVTTFSGGTEATAFNQNAIQALEEIGFQINSKDSGENPVYEVYYVRSSWWCVCGCRSVSAVSACDVYPRRRSVWIPAKYGSRAVRGLRGCRWGWRREIMFPFGYCTPSQPPPNATNFSRIWGRCPLGRWGSLFPLIDNPVPHRGLRRYAKR